MKKETLCRYVWVLYPVALATLLAWMISGQYLRYLGRGLTYSGRQLVQVHAPSTLNLQACLDTVDALPHLRMNDPDSYCQKGSPPGLVPSPVQEAQNDDWNDTT